ncbi:restriction endonuclease [Umboniibacter marinipuniceus]|uniref:Restriction system protein n=1 Tax=Umboniibacter marinipuniceus TaxID=569599 RepID=A0A3M0AEQ4_9GAMM|nr:restriction endonuclease [Umboniibacter marinipuniceus]RMA82634.1 restriction system protein [Umboniibacter marinipuniceus]
MAKRKDLGVYDILASFPWWVSVIVASLVYCFLKFALPLISFDNQIFDVVARSFSQVAWVFGLTLLMPALVGPVIRARKRRLLDTQQGISTIRSLSWRDFELLVAEVFRRKGYAVIENDGVGADGGIDMKLRKDGALHLVQCKHWQQYKVGVPIIREMYGVMVAEHALSTTIVTSGVFTQQAQDFARDKPIDLINGAALVAWMKQAQSGSVKAAGDAEYSNAGESSAASPKVEDKPISTEAPSTNDDSMECPKCDSPLVLRTATKGDYAGRQFYGCSSFPSCRYIRNLA